MNTENISSPSSSGNDGEGKNASEPKERSAATELWALTRNMLKNANFKNSEEYKLSEAIQQFGTIKDLIYKGFSFGEGAILSNHPRGATILTAEACEILEVDAEDYKIIKSKHEPEKKRKIDYLLRYIPEIDQINKFQIIEDMAFLLETKYFD